MADTDRARIETALLELSTPGATFKRREEAAATVGISTMALCFACVEIAKRE
jgi:hypothetical protein